MKVVLAVLLIAAVLTLSSWRGARTAGPAQAGDTEAWIVLYSGADSVPRLVSTTVADKEGRWFTQFSRDQIVWTTRQGVSRSATWLPGERLVIQGSRPDPIPAGAILVGDSADFRD